MLSKKSLLFLSLCSVVSPTLIAMQSKSMTLVPIMSAIKKGENEFLGTKLWDAVNKQQVTFMRYYLSKSKELSEISSQELQSCASKDVNIVNQFLKSNKFSIQLKH